VSVKPGTPPEHPGTFPEHPQNTPEQPRNTPGTPHNTPEHPQNSQEHPRTPKIVVRGQTAHELTKPKTSEDSQFFIGPDQPEISEHFKNASEYFRSFKEQRKNQ